MKLITKVLIITALIAGLTIIFTGCGQKQGLTKVKLNEVIHSVFYAPQYVALTQGFFKDEGLDVELSTSGASDKTMTAVLSGQADIGLAGPETAVYVYNQGKQDYAVVFAELTKRDGSFLIGRKPNQNFKWSNLKGKTVIGLRKGSSPEMSLEYALKKNNITPGKDVNILTNIQSPLVASSFSSGVGDYASVFEPGASILEKQGKAYILASVGKETGEMPFTAYIANKSYIEKNPEIIQKFTNAIYRAQLWVENHSPQDVARAIKPAFPDADENILVAVVKRHKAEDIWAKNPIFKESSFNLQQNVMESAGELKKRADYEKVINTTFAKKAVELVK